MSQFSIKVGDTRPVLEDTLSTDLTGATVRFITETLDGVVVIDADESEGAEIVDEAGGTVRYHWQAGDTETAGIFRGMWRCTFNDGLIETYPNTNNPNHPPLWIEIAS